MLRMGFYIDLDPPLLYRRSCALCQGESPTAAYISYETAVVSLPNSNKKETTLGTTSADANLYAPPRTYIRGGDNCIAVVT